MECFSKYIRSYKYKNYLMTEVIVINFVLEFSLTKSWNAFRKIEHTPLSLVKKIQVLESLSETKARILTKLTVTNLSIISYPIMIELIMYHFSKKNGDLNFE